MKLIKSFMLLAICFGTSNFLFAQLEPALATKPVEIKPAVVQDNKPNPAIISKQQNPAELKITDSQSNITATANEEMPKPQVVPFRDIANSSSSTDIIFPNTTLPKPIITETPPATAPVTAAKQVPAKKTAVVLQAPQ